MKHNNRLKVPGIGSRAKEGWLGRRGLTKSHKGEWDTCARGFAIEQNLATNALARKPLRNRKKKEKQIKKEGGKQEPVSEKLVIKRRSEGRPQAGPIKKKNTTAPKREGKKKTSKKGNTRIEKSSGQLVSKGKKKRGTKTSGEKIQTTRQKNGQYAPQVRTQTKNTIPAIKKLKKEQKTVRRCLLVAFAQVMNPRGPIETEKGGVQQKTGFKKQQKTNETGATWGRPNLRVYNRNGRRSAQKEEEKYQKRRPTRKKERKNKPRRCSLTCKSSRRIVPERGNGQQRG